MHSHIHIRTQTTPRNRVSVAATGDLHGNGSATAPAQGYALSGHNSGIQKVCVIGNRIVSASDDYELRVWDFAALR